MPLHDFAHQCGVHYQTALRWIYMKMIRAEKFNKHWHVHQDSLQDYFDRDNLLSIDRIFEVYGIHRVSIRAMVNRGELTPLRIANTQPGKFIFRKEELDKALEGRRQNKSDHLRGMVESLPPLREYGKGKNPRDDSANNGGGGNSKIYWIRRLKRDAPQYAKALAQGHYASVREAVRASGITKSRKKKEALT